MKLLYSTVATSIVKSRLTRTLEAQKIIPEGLRGWDKLLVTEPGNIESAEDFNIITADLRTSGKFNFSKYRNESMRYAATMGYDWLIQATVDIVMLRPPTSFPENGLTSVMTYHSKDGESVEDLIVGFKNGEELPWIGTSYLVMGRKIFENFSFCEDFYGYGYDDTDFLSNILWPEPHRIGRTEGTPFGARAIHIHDATHIWGETMVDDAVRNRALFEERARKVASGERLT